MNYTEKVQQKEEGQTTTVDNRLHTWVVEVFNLPKETETTFNDYHYSEGEHTLTATEIALTTGKNHKQTYTISKPVHDMAYEDIKQLKESIERRIIKKHPILGRLLRFFGWWLGFSGLYAMFAVCPFCGQAGCPVGIGGSGLIGGFFALCMQNWKAFFKFIHSKLNGKNSLTF